MQIQFVNNVDNNKKKWILSNNNNLCDVIKAIMLIKQLKEYNSIIII